jgi:plasmid stability protein
MTIAAKTPPFVTTQRLGPLYPPEGLPGRLTWRKNSSIVEEGGGAVATLNVKKVPEALYERLRSRARRQRRSVSQEVLRIISRALSEEPELSITELRGLGREVWDEADPLEYVRKERDSWT